MRVCSMARPSPRTVSKNFHYWICRRARNNDWKTSCLAWIDRPPLAQLTVCFTWLEPLLASMEPIWEWSRLNITRLWIITLLMYTCERLYSIEIQCQKRFHLKPKAAINCTEISSLICKTILIFQWTHFQYNSIYAKFTDIKSWIFTYSNMVIQLNLLESNFSLMT